ncbi:hypothetical protein [Brevibacillus reuszeri]|uniref:hypothetical protein n=1 Tax=Brevibacillus reuszeri TaxID=54915 RepID=UPI00289C51BC|nr:hypothetical protein [Brevibacillus reuszeri]
MFKSKLVKLADYREMKITDDMRETPLDDEEIKVKIDKLAKRNVVTTDVEMIEKGDYAIVDLKENKENFNKRILH